MSSSAAAAHAHAHEVLGKDNAGIDLTAVRAVTIIGSGPSGHTAAIYAARANLNPLMLEGFLAGGVAAGATARRMHLPGEDIYWQNGISACAVCDGAVPIFRKKPLAVIGGGDSAAEEATYLTKYGSKVYVLVRRDKLRASSVMQKRLLSNPKIEVLWNTVAEEAVGDGSLLNGLRIRNVVTKETSILPVNGLFYAIGHVPNTAFLNGQLDLDADGYIKVRPGTTFTNVEGVFACGDVQDKVYRQAISAAGTGCMAALEAERWLEAQDSHL